MEKKLIIVTSPPACGKTYISKELSKRLKHVVYLDKDTLIPLSKQIFAVAGQPYDRSSQFFEENIRNYEYDCIVALALEALDYDVHQLPSGEAVRKECEAGRYMGRNLPGDRPPAHDKAQF